MKISLIHWIIILGTICITACSSSTAKTEDSKDKQKTDIIEQGFPENPVGTWTGEESGKPMQFVFNSDGTGHENFHGEEIRPFSWVMKNNCPYITYKEQTTEWQIQGYDAKNGTITYGALVYYRE